jgi:hypothetical protein
VFYNDPPGRVRFARADLDEAAQRLAAILRAEHAEVLLSYQPNGGYGHRIRTEAGLTGWPVAANKVPPDTAAVGARSRVDGLRHNAVRTPLSSWMDLA